MKWTRYLLPVLMTGAFAVACGDDDETTGVTVADLAGDWDANSFVVSDNANLPVDPLDLVAVGVTVSLDIASSGSFSFATVGLDVASGGLLDDISITGTITITGNNTAEILVTGGTDPTEATFTLSGDDLTLSIPEAALIDFDGDGTITVDEEVVINASMSRP